MKNVLKLHHCAFIRKILIILAVIIMTNIFMGDTGVAEDTVALPESTYTPVLALQKQEPTEISREVACEIEIDKSNISLSGNMEFTNEIEDLRSEISDIKDGLSYPEIFKALYPKESYDKTVMVLAKVVHGEAEGVKSITNRACVIWCILNRVDRNHRGRTPRACATSSGQFAYVKGAKPRKDEIAIAKDVLNRWLLEKIGGSKEEVGRVLPQEIVYFSGNGDYNVFRYGYPIGSRKYSGSLHSEVYGD